MRSLITTGDTQHPRAGFSLVEMLVVMAIIAILSTLSFVVLGKSGEIAREAATKATMKVLSGAVRERVDAFHEITASPSQIDPDLPTKKESRIFRDRVAAFNRAFFSVNPPLPAPLPQAVEAYVRKTMFKSLFPQRVNDLYGYNGVLNNGAVDDSPLLARMWDPLNTPSPDWKTGSWMKKELVARAKLPVEIADDDLAESSELLYLILNEGDVFGLPPAEIDGIDDNMIGDTDGDGNLEFLDGWGRPLQFYNWPTRLIKDNGVTFTGTVIVGANTYTTSSLLISNLPQVSTGVAVLNGDVEVTSTKNRNRIDRDPDDVTRSLVRRNPGVIFPLSVNPVAPPAPFPAATTFNLGASVAWRFHPDSFHDPNTASMPLIVSGGADGVLGLYPPNTAGANRLARVLPTDEACQALGDNITNQQRGPQ